MRMCVSLFWFDFLGSVEAQFAALVRRFLLHLLPTCFKRIRQYAVRAKL